MKPNISILSFILNTHILKSDTNHEKNLYTLGLNIGYKLILVFKTDREPNLILLLQNLTYNFLPSLYSSKREITKTDKCYVLFENNPICSRFIDNDRFCGDMFMAGVIEAYIRSSGFVCEVEAYPNNEDGVIYAIKIDENDVQRSMNA